MRIQHRLTGYSKSTEMLELAFDIPPEHDDSVRNLASVPSSDVDGIGGYPVPVLVARQIGNLIRVNIDTERYDWFYEPIAAPLKRIYA